jgi:excisionase family DNA binding protein
VTEAARLLGIGRTLAYDLVTRGDLPAVRLGRRVLIPRHAIDTLLAGAPFDASEDR